MKHIEYAALNYYHSPISDECLCMGVLFYNVTTKRCDFKFISNFQRFHAFDDEADVDFVRLYLRGMKDEIESSNNTFNNQFDIRAYVRMYANEFRFSKVKSLMVEDEEDYVTVVSKIYLKYDLAKAQRLNMNEEKKLVRRLLESHNLAYSVKKINGPYNDEISFDYKVNDLCVKIFSFKDKNLKRLIGSARQWSFVANEMGNRDNVVFIYDSDFEDMQNLDTIIQILSRYAQVFKLDDGMDYILKQCS